MDANEIGERDRGHEGGWKGTTRACMYLDGRLSKKVEPERVLSRTHHGPQC